MSCKILGIRRGGKDIEGAAEVVRTCSICFTTAQKYVCLTTAQMSLRLGLILVRSLQNAEVMHAIALTKQVYLVPLRCSKAHFGAGGVSKFSSGIRGYFKTKI